MCSPNEPRWKSLKCNCVQVLQICFCSGMRQSWQTAIFLRQYTPPQLFNEPCTFNLGDSDAKQNEYPRGFVTSYMKMVIMCSWDGQRQWEERSLDTESLVMKKILLQFLPWSCNNFCHLMLPNATIPCTLWIRSAWIIVLFLKKSTLI